jgi:hypothetical protein
MRVATRIADNSTDQSFAPERVGSKTFSRVALDVFESHRIANKIVQLTMLPMKKYPPLTSP